MPDSPSTWTYIREWLTVGFVGLSALFAGLIWWLARKKLSNRYSLRVAQVMRPDKLVLNAEVLNRNDRDLMIDAISIDRPWYIVATEDGGIIASTSSQVHTNTKRVQKTGYSPVVSPEEAQRWKFIVGRDGGFSGCHSVSIRLHILSSFPVMRHRKKVLTATLPANIRNAQA